MKGTDARTAKTPEKSPGVSVAQLPGPKPLSLRVLDLRALFLKCGPDAKGHLDTLDELTWLAVRLNRENEHLRNLVGVAGNTGALG
jgi:hypothetical protein